MTPRHTLLALLVVVLWGFNFVAIDLGLAKVPPLVFLAMRFVLVAVPAVFFIRPPAIGWRNILLIGAFLSLGQFTLLYLALSLGMPPGLASLLLQTQIVFSVVVSSLLLREHPTRRQLVGLPLVITLLAALSWAIGNVLSRRARAASGLSLVVWSGLVVPVPSLGLALLVNGPQAVGYSLTHLSIAAILSTVYTAVAASLVAYTIWNSLLARYPTGAVVPFTLLVPVIGILAAWVVYRENPTASEIVGGAIMLGGLAAAVVNRRPRRRAFVPE